MFGANLVVSPQICGRLSQEQANFLEFWVKVAKMTLKIKVNDPQFQYQLRVSHACLVQICDELSHGQGQIYEWTDRQRQR